MDVRKYFDSISHDQVKKQLSKLIPDKQALNLFHIIIDSNNNISGRGIPIGNLTSQYFANHYLSSFDYYLKEKCHVQKYLRYMDDMLIFWTVRKSLRNYMIGHWHTYQKTFSTSQRFRAFYNDIRP